MKKVKDFSDMTDEEIGRSIRLQNEKQDEKRKLWNMKYELYEPMSNACKTLHDVYRGDNAKIRFADITPVQMLHDIYLVEETLKYAREKICEYIDVIKVYEDRFNESYE